MLNTMKNIEYTKLAEASVKNTIPINIERSIEDAMNRVLEILSILDSSVLLSINYN
jgi:hypothetical protein